MCVFVQRIIQRATVKLQWPAALLWCVLCCGTHMPTMGWTPACQAEGKSCMYPSSHSHSTLPPTTNHPPTPLNPSGKPIQIGSERWTYGSLTTAVRGEDFQVERRWWGGRRSTDYTRRENYMLEFERPVLFVSLIVLFNIHLKRMPFIYTELK